MAKAETEKRPGWAFEAGTEVGPGRTVVRLLGGGERYEAWLGWDDHLCSPVVLKFLRPDQLGSARARAAVEREAATLRALAHPGIVRIFGADLEAEAPYLVLEFLDGPRLSTLLRKYGPLSEEQIVPLAAEVTSALGYMHNEGLLHLDVKPQNIIMGAPPRLIDLSIARTAEEARHIASPLGTEAYMAPEQADPGLAAHIGPWSDVWGLGATLFEAANGFRPFPKAQPGEPATQLAQDPLPFHERVPQGVVDAIAGCLVRDPGARPTLVAIRDAFELMSRDARDAALQRIRRRVR